MGRTKVALASLALVVGVVTVVSCGSTKTKCGGGSSSDACAPTVAEAGEAGSAGAGVGGKGLGGAAAGGAAAGDGGVGAAEPVLGGAGAGGCSAEACGGCAYEGRHYGAGQQFVFSVGDSHSLCICQADGEVACHEGLDGCSRLHTQMWGLIAQARDCDPLSDVPQCDVLKTVLLPFTADYVGFFNASSVGALDGVAELNEFHSGLDCDAPIVVPPEPVPPTIAYCGQDRRCVDFWTGLNLLANGGFEQVNGAAPTSWALEPAPAFALTGEARTGTSALAATLSETGVTYRSTTSFRPAHAGGSLKATGHYRVDRVDSELSIVLTVKRGLPTEQSYVIAPPATAGDWQAFQITIDSSNTNINFGLRLLSGPTTQIVFDDLALEQIDGR